MSASWGSPQCFWLLALAAVVVQTLTLVLSVVFFNRVLHTMQDSFSGGSTSCLTDANLDFPSNQMKSDPCWQVVQQLRNHIEKAVFMENYKNRGILLLRGRNLGSFGHFEAMAARLEKEITSGVTNKLTSVLPFLHDGHVRPDVAGHVTATSSSSSPTEEDGVTRRRGYLGERVTAWEGSRGESFLRNVELRGGELLVPRAGLYYIYAQTYFRLSSTWSRDQEDDFDHDPDHDQEQEQEAAQLVQYIYKKMSSYTVPILLMKSSRSACWPRGRGPGMFSLNQAGTAFLQPDDRLFVTVSNASAVEADGRATYFGTFLVG